MNLSNLVNPMSEPISPGNRNHLSSDVEVKGTLKFQNDLVFDGKIEGEIQSNATLTVGKSANVQGEVKSKSVIIHGSVQGNIDAAPDESSLKTAPPSLENQKSARISLASRAQKAPARPEPPRLLTYRKKVLSKALLRCRLASRKRR